MKTVKLGDVCEFRRGLTYKKTDEVRKSQNIVLRANNIDPNGFKLNFDELRYISDAIEIPSAKYITKNTILICTASGSKSHLGKVALVDKDYGYAFGGFMGLLVPSHNLIDAKYLYLALVSKRFRELIDSLTDGTNINNLKFSLIADFEFFLPSLEEQRRVVERLDAAFEKIDRAIELTKKNIKQSELLFSSGIEQIFSNQNMANWKSYKVEEIGNVQTGTTPKTSIKENYGNYIPFIKPGDFRVDGSLNYENDALSKNGLKVGRFIPKNSVLMVCIGATITKTAVTTRDVSCNQQINAVSLPDATIAKFVYYQMITKKFKEKILNEAPKTTLPIINKGNWSALTVGFPETTEIENVVKNLDSLLNVSINLSEMYKNKLYKLSELKESLLTQTFEQGGVK